MVLCHKCLLIISNDRKHPEICVDALILRLSDFFCLPGKLKQKVVQLTPFSPIHIFYFYSKPMSCYQKQTETEMTHQSLFDVIQTTQMGSELGSSEPPLANPAHAKGIGGGPGGSLGNPGVHSGGDARHDMKKTFITEKKKFHSFLLKD